MRTVRTRAQDMSLISKNISFFVVIHGSIGKRPLTLSTANITFKCSSSLGFVLADIGTFFFLHNHRIEIAKWSTVLEGGARYNKHAMSA